jgi:DNA polymerase-3 subunit delta'
MRLIDLPWLATPWARATSAIKAERVPSGVLIHGNPGLGRLRLAEAMARSLLCLDPHPDGSACGACAACRKMDSGAHPDFVNVEPEEGKASILVEQVRELARALSLTASAKGTRCALIAPAEALTRQAQNALLKTLEEPPAGTTLILVADSSRHLLPTVLSRCLRLRVPTPDTAQALEWLNNRGERSDWALLLALGGRAPLAAERLAADSEKSLQPACDAVLDAVTGRGDPIAVANDFSAWPLRRYAMLIGWLASSALRAERGAGGASAKASPLQALASMGTHADERRLFRVWDEACALANDAVVRNAPLARERLILLFVNAFDFTSKQRSKT